MFTCPRCYGGNCIHVISRCAVHWRCSVERIGVVFRCRCLFCRCPHKGSVSEWWLAGGGCHDMRSAWVEPMWLTDAVWTYWPLIGQSFIPSRYWLILGVSAPYMPGFPEKLLIADNERAGTWHAWLSPTLLLTLVAAPSNRSPHAANHYCDTLRAWIETTFLIRNPHRQPDDNGGVFNRPADATTPSWRPGQLCRRGRHRCRRC